MALRRMLFSDALEGTEDKRSRDLMEAQRLMELGNIERERSETVAALRAYQGAQDLFQEHGDRIGEGLAWGNMAIVHQERGEYERAATLLNEALQIAQENNDSLSISVHLGNLGIAYQSMGQYEPAIEAYTQALKIYNDIGNKRHRGNIIGNLGILYAEQGDYARAIPILEEALDISREVEEKRFQGVHLANLGLVYQNLNQTQRAHDYFTQALGIALEIGSKLHEGIYLGNLGDTLHKLGRLDEAEANYRKAISISDQTFPIAAGAFRGALARLLAQQDKLDETLALLEKGESQVKSHDVEYVKFLSMKGQARHCAGDVQGAKDSLEEARKIVAQLDVHKDSEARKGIRELEAVLCGDSPGEAVLDPDHVPAIIEAQRMSRPLGRAEADADTVAVDVAPAGGSSSTESEDADTLLIPR